MSSPRQYDQIELGEITFAGFAARPPAFVAGSRVRGVRRAGQLYEWKIQERLSELYDSYYIRSPWLVFRTRSRPNLQYCQPDGLLVLLDRSSIIITEIKLRHTPDAFWQVEKLYQPVLQKIFEGRNWRFRRLEIVRWYDPNTYFPVNPILVEDPLLCPGRSMGVHICNP